MRRISAWVLFLLLITACTPVDPCTADPNLPECASRRAGAQATVAALSADRAVVERAATQQARQAEIAVHAQATQAAISIQATQVAVDMAATASVNGVMAQATKSAIEVNALKNSVVMSATQQAIAMGALKEQVVAQSTQTYLKGQAEVEQAQVQAASTGVREWLLIGLTLFVIISLGLSFAWYSRQTLHAIQHSVLMKGAFRTYGVNNNRAVLLMPGPRGQVHVTPIDDLIGDHILSDGTQSVLKLLDVTDREKLQAYVEQAKRRKAVEIAAVTGGWPELSSEDDDQSSGLAEPMNYPYTITTLSPTAQPVAAWLDEVDAKLLNPGG